MFISKEGQMIFPRPELSLQDLQGQRVICIIPGAFTTLKFSIVNFEFENFIKDRSI